MEDFGSSWAYVGNFINEDKLVTYISLEEDANTIHTLEGLPSSWSTNRGIEVDWFIKDFQSAWAYVGNVINHDKLVTYIAIRRTWKTQLISLSVALWRVITKSSRVTLLTVG